ncbi:MAG: TetR/AcrR family transcriptional regulator [Eubacteriales bacterium]
MNQKHDLKAQRVRSYFLEAAKQIISSEGVENISARKIADIAGYSYATIYNYYKDIDELLGETKSLMVSDVMKYMQDFINFTPANIEDIKKIFIVYVRYHIDHPHIFRFFYLFKLSEAEARKEQYDFSIPWASTFQFLIESKIIKANEINDCAKTLIYAVQGLLTLFFSGNGLTEEILFLDLERIIDFTLRR